MATELHPALIGALYDATFLEGGATVSIADDGEVGVPATGFAVSATPLDFTAQADEDPTRFFDVLLDVLADFNPPALGVWLEPGTRKIYIDPVEIYEQREDALAVAHARDELAIYDLSTQQVIPVTDGSTAGYEGYEN